MKKLSEKGKKTTRIVIIVILIIAFLALCFGFGTFAFIYLNSQPNQNNQGSHATTKIIAHRGHSEKYYDNTKEAFVSAIENDFFDGVETDIYLTKDGVWVCCHDENPFVDKSIKVPESNFSDIKDLPLDTSNALESADVSITYTLPTLQEYVEIVATSTYKLALVEIKGSYNADQLSSAMELVYSHLPSNRVIFGSFVLKSIKSVLEVNSHSKTLLFAGNGFLTYCYTKMGYNVGTSYKVVNDDVIELIRNEDSNLFVYTVDDYDLYLELLEKKVDFIITNRDLEENKE